MVLLAASVCTKSGKILVSRQFVEMNRPRIEGLLATFPKLISSNKGGKQHTFEETESVRYVYQPLDQLYMVLITTKNSNILEDLETLRLFSRVMPEYCKAMTEKEVLDNAFELVFAFDEVVALGYRESVNLAQIRTYTEMDSHEERVFYQIKKTQEEEAKKLARDKAKELARAKLDMAKMGKGMGATGMMGGISSNDSKFNPIAASLDNAPMKAPTPSYTQKPSAPNRALKLGQKKVDEDQFVSQLKAEGQDVATAPAAVAPTSAGRAAAPSKPAVKQDNIHLRTDERLVLTMSRDGGVQSMEVHGIVHLRINDPDKAHCKIHMQNDDSKGAMVQTHPNLDKKAWSSSATLALKNADKPFPVNNDIGVLKWRVQSTDESIVPLTINCWPSESAQGCDVNIEYTLENEDMTLNDVQIVIPLPPGANPIVASCDGDYKHERGRQQLVWSLPIVDRDSASGTLEFATPSGTADAFFPVRVNFTSEQQFVDITPKKVVAASGEESTFSQESTFYVEKYEIV